MRLSTAFASVAGGLGVEYSRTTAESLPFDRADLWSRDGVCKMVTCFILLTYFSRRLVVSFRTCSASAVCTSGCYSLVTLVQFKTLFVHAK